MRFQTNNLRRRAKLLFLLFSVVFFPVFVWLGFDAVRLLYFHPSTPYFTKRLPKGTLSPVFATITYEDKEHNLLLVDEKRNIFLLIDNESGIVDYTGCDPNHDWPPESLTLSFDKSGILQNNEDGYLHICIPSQKNEIDNLILRVENDSIYLKNPSNEELAIHFDLCGNSLYYVDADRTVRQYNLEYNYTQSINRKVNSVQHSSFFELLRGIGVLVQRVSSAPKPQVSDAISEENLEDAQVDNVIKK